MIAVLAGASLAETATTAGLERTDLAEAGETYRLGRRQALTKQEAASWRQIYVRFPDWDASEHNAVTHLAPFWSPPGLLKRCVPGLQVCVFLVRWPPSSSAV
ncbi:hypothetical protein [Actinomadura soli]|uniref:hypothetical protein n=1 Tax=Actinomadura soli TaxID=2508997 RepID=UPI0014868CC5|nr:hypothetical protein [Actinomadura soli]